jgi:hypothetical protein
MSNVTIAFLPQFQLKRDESKEGYKKYFSFFHIKWVPRHMIDNLLAHIIFFHAVLKKFSTNGRLQLQKIQK